VENYPGFPNISGTELAQKMVAHAKSAGVKISEFEKVVKMDLKDERKVVETDKGTYEARVVIIASGSEYRHLGVPGEKELRGRGVSYCGLCDGPFFKNKRVLVVGGGNSALMTALYLAHIGSDVKVAHRREAFRAEEALIQALKSAENIEVLWNSEIKEILGDKMVRGVRVFNNKTGENKEVRFDGVFIQVGETPNSETAREAGVSVNENNYVIIDGLQHTNLEGVYAAGDVTNHPVKQIGTAVGQGITAAIEAFVYVRRPYHRKQ
jgi:thioredoxin reductase (NADPH)